METRLLRVTDEGTDEELVAQRRAGAGAMASKYVGSCIDTGS